jgi:hypothetical protein
MYMERVWNTASRRALAQVADQNRRAGARAELAKAVAVVCLIVLLTLIVLGGLLILFHRVTAELPLTLILQCPDVKGCSATGLNENQPLSLDDPHTEAPQMTR